MDAELVALATNAASAVVGAMATDGWQALRSRVARLLGRGDPRAERDALETLDEDAAGRTPDTERDLVAEWRGRLRDLLRTDPAAAAALRELLQDARVAGPASGSLVAASHIGAPLTTGFPTPPGTDRV
ncbi:hypothetical protein Dvina_06795 [Dactylosporangium vinaceum]|uniref:Uncharacterized protein n=1 Tax=Dactylosporangium vinaceum TaxID=53362 RepID=A0ABV5M6C9_9ACTN|nr:hypothetical protein [Dactylosporangium vinaceum]UAB97824.1 hypothetical protein Dvina_06795 [Dactylosporangium vinaceum]